MRKSIIYGLTMLNALAFLSGNAQDKNTSINKIQVIGSHNSYRQQLERPLYEVLREKDTTNRLQYLEYDHIPITDQLDMGLCNLEIDIYADSKGGRFAHPKGLEMAKLKPYDPKGEMDRPGFKVLHMPDIDFRSWYLTFEACLRDLRKWSDAHPKHMPIFITLEPKQGAVGPFGTDTEDFTPSLFKEMDDLILGTLGAEKVITPDMVRGSHPTLEAAVLGGNWPSLNDARGSFLFIMDNNGALRDLYIKDHASLRNRAIFVNAKPGTPEAATLFKNDPEDIKIPDLVKQGYIIRTRADANTVEARNNDYGHFTAAKNSGAQIITTDYYLPSTLFESTYQVQFDDGGYVRPNPVNSEKKNK